MPHSGEDMKEGGTVVIPLKRQQTAIHGDSTSAPHKHTGMGQIINNHCYKHYHCHKKRSISCKNYQQYELHKVYTTAKLVVIASKDYQDDGWI